MLRKPKQKTRYVLGFAFNPQLTRVVLIRKQKPESLRGLLNGVGGKIELAETPRMAMSREFMEETGLFIHENSWIHLGHQVQEAYEIDTFYVVDDRILDCATQPDEEEIEIHEFWRAKELQGLQHGMAPNAFWLMCMAIDSIRHKEEVFATYGYHELRC